MKPEFADMASDFSEESSELLEAMEESLFEIQDEGMNSENINSIFRAAHTIKGASGLFELDYLVKFTHVAENLLDEIRNHKIEINDDIVNLYFEVKDQMQELVDWALENEDDPSDDLNQTTNNLIERLNFYLNGGTSEELQEEEPNEETDEPQQEDDTKQIEESKEIEDFKQETQAIDSSQILQNDSLQTNNFDLLKYNIILEFTDIPEYGMEPLEFIKILKNIGEVTNLKSDDSGIPDLLDFNSSSGIRFEFIFGTTFTREKLDEIFNKVKDYANVQINELSNNIDKQDKQPKQQSVSIKINPPRIVKKDTDNSIEIAPKEIEKENTQEDKESVAITKPNPPKEPEPVTPTQPAQKPKAPPKPAASKPKTKKDDHIIKTSHTLRVESHKIDALINLIGEMVIANSNLIQQISTKGDKELLEAVSVTTRMLENLREVAMQTRMVPIGETFSKYKRIVRDLSRELGKEIELEIIGGDTELDKSVTEKISDPLIHLVRNSLDHGIESAEVRESIGKSKVGKLILKAYHESGSVAIEIEDDGKGLDAEFLKQKAIEKGLIQPDAVLSEKEAFELIMLAGFSTAATISNISGRGVGMDVVRRNIEELRGTIEIDSKLGKGTRIIIKLPLTLAIIDGFLVRIGQTHFVIPLDIIVECIELTQNQIDEMKNNDYINLRGALLPLVDLRVYFQTKTNNDAKENIAIVKYGDKSIGLIVNELLGEFQTVIKPMGEVFKNIKGIGGATILGSGEVAMILDVPILLKTIGTIL